MPAAEYILTQKNREAYARLTAPQHMTVEHFRLHQKIEGYFENRTAPDFMGSDRLVKMDTLYGTVQMGYNPRRGQSFIFAHIKTSVFDTAAFRHQRELADYQMARAQKTGTQNIAYSSGRRSGSAVLLYKAQNRPWSRDSAAAYLRTANLEALRKTMPFLDLSGERAERRNAQREQKALQGELAAQPARKAYGEAAAIRARQTALSARLDAQNALLYRGDAQMRGFFRRLNYAMDMQKNEMLAYYRGRRLGGKGAERDAAPGEPVRNEENDE